MEFPDVPYIDVASELVSQFTPYEGPVEPDSFRNFLGVRTRCKYLPEWYQQWAGKTQGLPVGKYSDGLHDAAEWCGVLSAVLDAKDQIVGVELGAGWAPWLVCATVAARQKGIVKQRLVAVEADATNVDFIKMHFLDNNITPGDHTIIQGMCSAAAGFNLATLLADLPTVDFIHVDIQGYELEVIEPALPALNQRVRRLIVGTHGRELDGKMFALMSKAGWTLEHEKTSVHRSPDLILTEDGAQVWKNHSSLDDELSQQSRHESQTATGNTNVSQNLLQSEIDDLKSTCDSLQGALCQTTAARDHFQEEAARLERTLSLIMSSRCWRLTSPLRTIVGASRRWLR